MRKHILVFLTTLLVAATVPTMSMGQSNSGLDAYTESPPSAGTDASSGHRGSASGAGGDSDSTSPGSLSGVAGQVAEGNRSLAQSSDHGKSASRGGNDPVGDVRGVFPGDKGWSTREDLPIAAGFGLAAIGDLIEQRDENSTSSDASGNEVSTVVVIAGILLLVAGCSWLFRRIRRQEPGIA